MFDVLIVNNQDLTKRVLRKIFEKSKLAEKIEDVKTGKEAISYIRKNHPDIVVFEPILPNVKINDFIKEIKEINSNIKILILASNRQIVNLSKFKIPIDSFLIKPIDEDKLIKKLKSLKKDFIYVDIDGFFEKFNLVLNEKNFKKCQKFLKKEIKSLGKKEDGPIYKKKVSYLIERIFKDKLNYPSVKMDIDKINIKDPLFLDTFSFKLTDKFYRLRAVKNYPILKDVFKYIDENIYENISLNDIVVNCAISQAYLSRLFKSQIHLTVVNYINLVKVNISKDLIIREKLTVAETAEKLQYNDYSYFSKVFKKYEKQTIEQYKAFIKKA